MEKKIEILSQLTVDEINELRLFISLARYNSYDKAIEWAEALNKAAERKQEYTTYEDIDYDTTNLGI